MRHPPASSARRCLPRLRSGILVLGLATAVTHVKPARAQDAGSQGTPQAIGRSLFNEGVALFNKGDYEAACTKLEASLKAFSGIGTRGKLAECYEKLGRYASAYVAYREVAQLATRSGDPAREQIASERAKSLEPKLSYVTVTLPPANDLPGLVIKRNGREIDRSKLGAAEPVDAGNIAIDVSAPGRKTFNGHVAVMQGLAVRFEVPSLAVDAPARSDSPPPVASSPLSSSTPKDEPPASAIYGDPPRWRTPLGIVLIGAGAVGLGLGSYFGLSAKSKYDGAFDNGSCDRATKACDASGQSATDDAHSKATISTIMFAAGAGLAVVGVVVLLTAPSSKPRAAQGLRIAPTGYAGGGGGFVLGGVL